MEPVKFPFGTRGLALKHVIDDFEVVDESRVEWRELAFGSYTEINGHRLLARQVRIGLATAWDAWLDGSFLARFDTATACMAYVLERCLMRKENRYEQ